MLVWLGRRTVPKDQVSTRCYLAGRYKLGRSLHFKEGHTRLTTVPLNHRLTLGINDEDIFVFRSEKLIILN